MLSTVMRICRPFLVARMVSRPAQLLNRSTTSKRPLVTARLARVSVGHNGEPVPSRRSNAKLCGVESTAPLLRNRPE
jgi:hypothetical protein